MYKLWGTRNLNNLRIALDSLVANRLRSFLTALGIIFGVGAVIAMLAIGKGAQEEILEQMKLVGVNNIVIKPKVSNTKDNEDNNKENSDGPKDPNAVKRFSRGLSLADARSIAKVVPTVEEISPEIMKQEDVIYGSKSKKLQLVGIDTSFFNINNIAIAEGKNFNSDQLIDGDAVCIIGSGVKKRFFVGEEAIGKRIKCGPQWLKVVGVTEEKNINSAMKANLGIRDYNMDIYLPIKSYYTRYMNPAKQTFLQDGEENMQRSMSGNNDAVAKEIDQLVIKVNKPENLTVSADIINRMLTRMHNDVVDFEISIPEQLLKQQQKTKDVFNIVLSAIAGISLLVGGIGIMNIMLASVLERTREIGIRMAIGAQKRDIVMQFLFEAVLISLAGGILGVLLGVVGAYLVDKVAEINTIISGLSIFVSFILASAVGIVFGITPARKAASQDPIQCLRHV